MQNLTDREISWLAFNQRVLELSEDTSLPLLERVRFLTIFSSNLDEFYMVRVASVLRKIENNISTVNSAGYAPQELLAESLASQKTLSLTSIESLNRISARPLRKKVLSLSHGLI
jgi:polyphosphate kinase